MWEGPLTLQLGGGGEAMGCCKLAHSVRHGAFTWIHWLWWLHMCEGTIASVSMWRNHSQCIHVKAP